LSFIYSSWFLMFSFATGACENRMKNQRGNGKSPVNGGF
jgi:hypothetical protein